MRHSEIQRLLPEIFRRTIVPGTPLSALLEVMELLHERASRAIGRWDELLDPLLTDDDWVPFLGRWLDQERFFEAGRATDHCDSGVTQSNRLGRLRELAGAGAQIAQWRGTARGLLLVLETVTGLPGQFMIDEQVRGPGSDVLPFHICVRAPASVLSDRCLLDRIIQQEKPAYVTYTLEFNGLPTPR
jgi:hypothetical protein